MDQLKIGILDFSGLFKKEEKETVLNETDMLVKSIEKLGHKSIVYPVEECQLYFHGRKYEVLRKNEPLELCDVLIPRVSIASSLEVGASVLKQFQFMKVPVVNRYLPTLNAKNKLRTLQILGQKGIPVPKTVVVRRFEYLDEAIKVVGGYPVVLKSAYGSYGCGVVIVESRRSLYSALDLIMEGMRSDILLIQEYIAEADGSDYRAFVIDGKVVACMKRQAKTGDFRSNLHLGGHAAQIKLTKQERALAVRATKALNLQIAGVDILRSKNGPVIMEVNANPGFMGLMDITGIDVAKAFIEYAISFAHSKRALKKSAIKKSA